MSEGSITYQEEDAECGIRTVINSQLKSHLVCNDGLACMRTDVGNGAEVKQCHSVKIISGERCVPGYDNCYGDLNCMLSPLGGYTCGGNLPWGGNEAYVMHGYVGMSKFEVNIGLIVAGAFLMVFYILFIAWRWVREGDEDGIRYTEVNSDSIYPNRFTKEKKSDGWSFNIFRRVLCRL